VYLRFSPLTVIPQMLHSHLYLYVTLIRKTGGEACDPSNKAVLSDVGKHCTEQYRIILVRKVLINALLTCFALSVLELMQTNSRYFIVFYLQTFWRVTQ
jgi:hypothetical protein